MTVMMMMTTATTTTTTTIHFMNIHYQKIFDLLSERRLNAIVKTPFSIICLGLILFALLSILRAIYNNHPLTLSAHIDTKRYYNT